MIEEKAIIKLKTATTSFQGLRDITSTDLPPRQKPHLIMAPEGILLATSIVLRMAKSFHGRSQRYPNTSP